MAFKQKKTMHSCSASSGKPDSNSLDCIVFSCLEVYRDWNRWSDEGFPFLGSDVSISWVYLLSQMLFWQLMYLQALDIRYCRCSFNALRILHIKILHLQSPKIHYRKYLSHNILWVLFTSQLEPIHYLQKNWYKKFERIWSERWRHLERRFLW